MKFAIFYLTIIGTILFLVDGAAAAPSPPDKIGNGKPVNRVEYVYYDEVGHIVGIKIYDCNGWVVGWGAPGAMQEIKMTPCK